MTQISFKRKIIIKDKNDNYLGKIIIDEKSDVNYIGEIKEEEDYVIIISIDDKLYKLLKPFNKLEIICDMKINLIFQINKNEYIISNDNGTFKYDGSILKISKENLKNEDKKIIDEQCNFGILVNKKIIALACTNQLILYDNFDKKPISKLKLGYDNFCENCYALFKSKFFMFFFRNTYENNILLFGCKKGGKNGFLIKEIESDEEEKFLETGDFEINCLLQIIKRMVEAFSVEYNKKYTYYLVGGYEHDKNTNKIKLLIIQLIYTSF